MKKIILVLAMVVFGFAQTGYAKNFKIKTPLGIQVTANQKVIKQYEETWGPWENIQWEAIDVAYVLYWYYYNPLRVYQFHPEKIKVTVVPYAPQCLEEGADCIDGTIRGHNIKIHLGNDPGYMLNAFCDTSLHYLLQKWFLWQMGNKKCYAGIDDLEEYPECSQYVAPPEWDDCYE